MTLRPSLRTLRRLLLSAAAFAALAVAAPAAAQSASATFQVTASVARKCVIAATDVVVGAYDPVETNVSAAATATGTVTFRCTRGTTYSVGLGTGANPSGSIRRMAGPAGTYLEYDLFSESTYTDVWGTGAGNEVTGLQGPGGAPVDLTVYARVPGGQDPVEGAYVDSVVATINF